VAATGGPWEVETRHLAEITRLSREGFMNIAGNTSVPTMAAALSRAALVVTVDTAALHLAAAFGVPAGGALWTDQPVSLEAPARASLDRSGRQARSCPGQLPVPQTG